jgi:hypothetical protein
MLNDWLAKHKSAGRRIVKRCAIAAPTPALLPVTKALVPVSLRSMSPRLPDGTDRQTSDGRRGRMVAMTSGDYIIELDDDITVLTIDRPPVRVAAGEPVRAPLADQLVAPALLVAGAMAATWLAYSM